MNQTYSRNSLVDIMKSDMPNYSVYQRNLGKTPIGIQYSNTLNNPILIDKYDQNLNEKFHQFSSRLSSNNTINPQSQSQQYSQYPQSQSQQYYDQLQQQQQEQYQQYQYENIQQQKYIPNFDIDYKGTRSLFNRKYKKNSMSVINQQLEQLKTSASLSQSIPISSQSQLSNSSGVYIKDSQIHSQLSPQRLTSPNHSSTILSRTITFNDNEIYRNNNNQFNQYYNNNQQYSRLYNSSVFENKNFQNSRIKSGLITLDENNQINKVPYIDQSNNGVVDENNLSNYSQYLRNSGERKIFTSEKKSHLASKLMYVKPQYEQQQQQLFQQSYVGQQQEINEFGQENNNQFRNDYNLTKTNPIYPSIDTPQVFLRSNLLY